MYVCSLVVVSFQCLIRIYILGHVIGVFRSRLMRPPGQLIVELILKDHVVVVGGVEFDCAPTRVA